MKYDYISVKHGVKWPVKIGTEDSAGIDLPTVLSLPQSNGVNLIITNVRVRLPYDSMGLLTLRSSAHKYGIRAATGVGIIDADYRGELKFATLGSIPRIGAYYLQLIVVPVLRPTLWSRGSIRHDETKRGEGGFGSSSTGDLLQLVS